MKRKGTHRHRTDCWLSRGRGGWEGRTGSLGLADGNAHIYRMDKQGSTGEHRKLYSNQFSSAAQSCPTLCDPMDCSTPGLPVHHHLPELTQTHVHQVGDAIQPSHPLSSPSPPAPNPSQHQGLFQWVSSLHQVAKGLELQLQHQSSPTQYPLIKHNGKEYEKMCVYVCVCVCMYNRVSLYRRS